MEKNRTDFIALIEKTAEENGWQLLDIQDNIGMVSFIRGNNGERERVNIYVTKMTVGTCINHPTKGKTQLFRKHQTIASIKEILKNPRIHTNEGYYQKAELRDTP
jgi:hypothetical protein